MKKLVLVTLIGSVITTGIAIDRLSVKRIPDEKLNQIIFEFASRLESFENNYHGMSADKANCLITNNCKKKD